MFEMLCEHENSSLIDVSYVNIGCTSLSKYKMVLHQMFIIPHLVLMVHQDLQAFLNVYVLLF